MTKYNKTVNSHEEVMNNSLTSQYSAHFLFSFITVCKLSKSPVSAKGNKKKGSFQAKHPPSNSSCTTSDNLKIPGAIQRVADQVCI